MYRHLFFVVVVSVLVLVFSLVKILAIRHDLDHLHVSRLVVLFFLWCVVVVTDIDGCKCTSAATDRIVMLKDSGVCKSVPSRGGTNISQLLQNRAFFFFFLFDLALRLFVLLVGTSEYPNKVFVAYVHRVVA